MLPPVKFAGSDVADDPVMVIWVSVSGHAEMLDSETTLHPSLQHGHMTIINTITNGKVLAVQVGVNVGSFISVGEFVTPSCSAPVFVRKTTSEVKKKKKKSCHTPDTRAGSVD